MRMEEEPARDPSPVGGEVSRPHHRAGEDQEERLEERVEDLEGGRFPAPRAQRQHHQVQLAGRGQ